MMRIPPIFLICAVAGVFTLAGVTGCSARRPAAAAAVDAEAERHGRLQLVAVAQRFDGTMVHLDITVANTHAQPVSGVRVLYRVVVEPDPEALEVARVQEEFALDIAPGAQAQVSITLPPEATQSAGFGTFLHAFAVQRGGVPLPIPPLWRANPA